MAAGRARSASSASRAACSRISRLPASIAAGDSFVQQLVGHGLAARLSAKLGEGVVNGMMTARIGIAAMETVRPLPFNALKRPRLSDFLASLAIFQQPQGARRRRVRTAEFMPGDAGFRRSGDEALTILGHGRLTAMQPGQA